MGEKFEKFCKKELPVKLASNERFDRTLLMTEAMDRKDDIEVAAKINAKLAKDQVKSIAKEISRLHRIVKTGYEPRMVDCSWTFDFDKNEKSLIRIDTGEEVERKPLTESERQLAMSMDKVHD